MTLESSDLLLEHLFASVTLLLFSVPLVLEKVPPNRYFGFRTKQTLNDATVWYRVNRTAGWSFLCLALTGIALSVSLISVFGMSRVQAQLACGGVLTIGVGVSALFGWLASGK